MGNPGAGAEPVITCGKCGAEIRLTESLAGPVIQRLEVEWRRRLQTETARAAEEAKTEARREVELELKAVRDEAVQKAKLLAEAQKNELELRKRGAELEERARALDLEVQRKLDAERARVREQAQKDFAEQQKQRDEQLRLQAAEKDKLVDDLRHQLVEMQRKAEQGSQQLQGEVLELDLEASLRAAFPRDTIEPVAKGQLGGDCLQRVFSPGGQPAGTILWESKRTRSWSDGWLAKLRDDQRAAKADCAILITQTLPKGVERFGPLESVWVTEIGCALPLTAALRQSLIELAAVRQSAVGRQTKMELLYAWLTGPEFRRRVEGILEAFGTMREDLDRERAWLQRQWAKREKELARVLESTAGMYGDLQGIAGQALPEIDGLEHKALEEGSASGAGPAA